jgi:hypothetical protein
VTTDLEIRTEPPLVDHELVIREARRRRRRRHLVLFGAAGVLVVTGAIAGTAMGTGGSGPPVSPAPPRPHTLPATNSPAPPAPAAISAGRFEGTWRAHTTSVTIGADGTGTLTWPGTVAPGGSEATAVANTAALHLTLVNGAVATGVVSGSTDQTQLPNGRVQLQISGRDVLEVVPSQAIAVTPLLWSSLCGARALSMTVAQQAAAGINCGA